MGEPDAEVEIHGRTDRDGVEAGRGRDTGGGSDSETRDHGVYFLLVHLSLAWHKLISSERIWCRWGKKSQDVYQSC